MSLEDNKESLLDMSFSDDSHFTMRCTTQHIKRSFNEIEEGNLEKTETKYIDSLCPICHENFNNENDVAITDCGHHACKKCMSDCLEQSHECFKCRNTIIKISTMEWGIIDINDFLGNFLKEQIMIDYTHIPTRQVTFNYYGNTQNDFYDNVRENNHMIVLPSVPVTNSVRESINSTTELVSIYSKKFNLYDNELSTLVLISPFIELTSYEMNIYIIIDVSGSMSSEDRIKFCKDAVSETVKKLKQNQRITIITFDNYSVQEIPLTPINSLNIDKILSKIDNISAVGGTNYNIAFEHLNKILCDGNNIVFFMTDGEPSEESNISILEKLYTDYPTLVIYIISMGSDVDAAKNLLPLLCNRSDELGIYMHFHDFDSFVPFINNIVGSSTATFATNIKIKFYGCIPISSKCIQENDYILLNYGALQYNNTLQIAYTNNIDTNQSISISYDINGISYEVFPKFDENAILGIELDKHFPTKRFMDRRINEIFFDISLSKKEKKQFLQNILSSIKEEDLGSFYEEFTKCLRLLIENITSLTTRRTYNAENSFLQSQSTNISRDVSVNLSFRNVSQRVHFQDNIENELEDIQDGMF